MPFADLTEYRAKAKFKQIANKRLAYWQAGQGEVVLLVHGFPSAAWDWHYLWEPLSQRYQLVALDLLGFGLSDKPYPYHYSIAEQASLVVALLAQLNIQKCHIVAHDYGDSVAQEVLRKAEAGESNIELSSITFLNGGLFPESHRPLLTQKLLKSRLGPLLSRFMTKKGLRKSFTQIFGINTPPKDDEIDAVWALLSHNQGVRVMSPMLAYLDERRAYRDRWLQAMQTTKVPLQFINGIEDPISGLHMLKRYEELIPNPNGHQLQAGHYPQLEVPKEVLAKVSEFIEHHSSAT